MTAGEGEPILNETADMQIDRQISKLAEQYASCDRRSDEINEERKTIRDNMDKLGIMPAAFMDEVRYQKKFSKGEQRDYETGRRRVRGAVAPMQMDLYPEQTKRNEARDAERKAAKARKPDKASMDERSDASERSDPKKGGAGKKKPAKGKSPAEATAAGAAASDAALAAAIAKNHDAEQAEGDVILGDGIPSVAS